MGDILLAPVADPHAPPGFVSGDFLNAETKRRKVAVRAVIDRVAHTIADLYGPKAASSARDHFDDVLRAIGFNDE